MKQNIWTMIKEKIVHCHLRVRWLLCPQLYMSVRLGKSHLTGKRRLHYEVCVPQPHPDGAFLIPQLCLFILKSQPCPLRILAPHQRTYEETFL